MVWDTSVLIFWLPSCPKVLFLYLSPWQKQTKTSKNKQKQWWSWSSKHAFALFSHFFWRGPRALWSKFVDLWKLYLLVHSASQDQAWLLKNALPPPSNPQTQKWKVAVLWLIDGIVWGLWNGSDRASFALSSSVAWTSTVLKLMEIQAKNCFFDLVFVIIRATK